MMRLPTGPVAPTIHNPSPLRVSTKYNSKWPEAEIWVVKPSLAAAESLFQAMAKMELRRAATISSGSTRRRSTNFAACCKAATNCSG